MSTSREQFLQRVREAVTEGDRAGGSPAPPQRGAIGYQGAGPIRSLASALSSLPPADTRMSSLIAPAPRPSSSNWCGRDQHDASSSVAATFWPGCKSSSRCKPRESR